MLETQILTFLKCVSNIPVALIKVPDNKGTYLDNYRCIYDTMIYNT